MDIDSIQNRERRRITRGALTIMDFALQFSELTDAAYYYIMDTVKQQKVITLFLEPSDKIAEWDVIFEDVPDFAFYEELESAEWAAIKELRYCADDTIEIDGILKGESYPRKITTTLPELAGACMIELAAFLSTRNVK